MFYRFVYRVVVVCVIVVVFCVLCMRAQEFANKFNVFDDNGNGFIDMMELKRVPLCVVVFVFVCLLFV